MKYLKIKDSVFIILTVVLVVVLTVLQFTKLSDKHSVKDSLKEEKIHIVTTIFPVYDWVRRIAGENNKNIELKLLLKNGADLHNYTPTTEDILAISESDIFINVGGHSDEWVKDVLQTAKNNKRIHVNLFEILKDDLKPLKMSKGMGHVHESEKCVNKEHSHEHDKHHEHEHHEHKHHEHEHHEHEHHEHEHHEHEHHEHDNINDEHLWLSLKRSVKAVNAISEKIISADPANASLYRANTDKFVAELKKLDEEYEKTAAEGKQKTIVFADRFPFFYMADDYGLEYYAAFSGCSAESEASFETVAVLAEIINELEIKNILSIEKRTHKIPETVIKNTKKRDQKVLVMHSLQSVTEEEIKQGTTYLDTMKKNLSVLKTALE